MAQVDTQLGDFQRSSSYLQQPIFNMYQSEHEMLRYLKRLENRDLSLTHSMISLVRPPSCPAHRCRLACLPSQRPSEWLRRWSCQDRSSSPGMSAGAFDWQ